MYDRDIAHNKKTQDDALIAKGIAPADSLVHRDDDELTEEQKQQKLELKATVEANAKQVEAQKKAHEERVDKPLEDWVAEMPEKYLTGKQAAP